MMTPDRWQQVKCVLQEALEIAPEQRPAFLDRACSTDHSLRREVESLLSSNNEVRSSFMKSAANAGLRLTKGTRLGDFEILSLVGAGGMGEVYRALDRRLERDVAIKVLPRFVSFDPERLSRFEQEAKAAAALNHPNILAVFHMGTYESAPYLVSELLDGETLREQIKRGPIALKKAIDYGLQIAHGLAAAHGKGIVHRDLKPENLFVTSDGRIKILDFGLAKLTHAEPETQVTKQTLDTEPGAVLGTVGYMSPEQVRGLGADHHSDIFAFGAILYEMLSGKRAFQGENSADTMSAILKEDPLPLSGSVRGIPPALEHAVKRCLKKNAEQRFQSAEELLAAVREIGTSPAVDVAMSRHWYALRWRARAFAPLILLTLLTAVIWGAMHYWPNRTLNFAKSPSFEVRSIAVLPLQNLSGDPSQEYLADGMTEELTTDLAKIAHLRVISHTSVAQYKVAKKPLPDIARELNVDAVVEGSVMRSGDRVRITAQLIHAPTDRHMWAESYERDEGEVMRLEHQVALAIAHEVSLQLSPTEESRLTSKRATNPRAYDAYLRGRYLWNERNAEAITEAVGYFEQAVREEPDFALAYSGLSDCYSISWGAKQDLSLAEEYARKALALEPDLVEGHTSLGIADLRLYKFGDAEKELRRALELNPNYVMAHQSYANFLLASGRLPDALAENDRARQLDPFSFPVNVMRGGIFIGLHQYERAVEQIENTAAISPQSPVPHGELARVYWIEQKVPDAIAEERKAATLSHSLERLREQEEVAAAFARLGLRAAQLKAALLKQNGYKSNYLALDIALQYGDLEDRQEALRWLNQSFLDRDGNLAVFMKSAPEFEFVRSDPHFQDLLRRIGLPQ